jgi:hypothetical protein
MEHETGSVDREKRPGLFFDGTFLFGTGGVLSITPVSRPVWVRDLLRAVYRAASAHRISLVGWFHVFILPAIPTYVATTFESVCREAVWEGIRRGAFEPYSEVGRWWYRKDDTMGRSNAAGRSR